MNAPGGLARMAAPARTPSEATYAHAPPDTRACRVRKVGHKQNNNNNNTGFYTAGTLTKC